MRIDKSEKLNIIGRLAREFRYMTKRTWTYEEAGKHWDVTTDYDDVNKKTHSYFRRFVDGMRACSIPGNSHILDICGRTGNGSIYFYNNGKVRSVVCADVTRRMLNICESRLRECGIEHKTVYFDRLPLPFKDSEFDAILCFETIEHMPYPSDFMLELFRVLKPKGELLLTTPSALYSPAQRLVAVLGLHHSEGPHKFLTRRFLLWIAREAGFLLEKEKTTVIIPSGPTWLTDIGIVVETLLPELVLRHIAERRIFIFRRP